MAENDLRSELAALRTEIGKLTVAVATLPSRADFTSELDKRVTTATYEVAHRALEADVKEIAADLAGFKQRSAGTMQRAAPWVALGVTILFSTVNTLIAAAALIIALTH